MHWRRINARIKKPLIILFHFIFYFVSSICVLTPAAADAAPFSAFFCRSEPYNSTREKSRSTNKKKRRKNKTDRHCELWYTFIAFNFSISLRAKLFSDRFFCSLNSFICIFHNIRVSNWKNTTIENSCIACSGRSISGGPFRNFLIEQIFQKSINVQ